ELAAARMGLVREQQVVPVPELPGDRLRVGIEQELGLVEAQPPLRPVLALHLVAVELPRSDPADLRVPDELVALLEADDVGWPPGSSKSRSSTADALRE